MPWASDVPTGEIIKLVLGGQEIKVKLERVQGKRARIVISAPDEVRITKEKGWMS
jgi:sRNA-binding carbon storage regulator CsrA